MPKWLARVARASVISFVDRVNRRTFTLRVLAWLPIDKRIQCKLSLEDGRGKVLGYINLDSADRSVLIFGPCDICVTDISANGSMIHIALMADD